MSRVRWSSFTLQGDSNFTYTVTASDTPGDYTFSGVLRDSTRVDHPIPDSTITVEAPAPPSATRSFPSEYVAPGGEVVVTIDRQRLRRIWCRQGNAARWVHLRMSSSLEDFQVNVSGQVATFTLQGDSNFTYTVTAPMTEGSYTFSGVLTDSTRVDHPMADSTIMVGTAGNPEPVTPEPVTPEPVTPEPVLIPPSQHARRDRPRLRLRRSRLRSCPT